ncbi:hypothetical protein [Calothrix sp. CCY 0018]|uniref:hypothetical protein n=1 Tax=Calothrix sp. CCY 0018 TaxID=3103864 RepID=UPI0039C681D6
MQRATQIATIIEKRRPLAEKIATVEGSLKTLAATLREIDEYRTKLISTIEEERVIGYLKEIYLSNVLSEIDIELQAIGKIKARFSRETLNVGVVGRARQGKSRLLQSLSGLTASEIPDGDRQHCTGVRSTIHHNKNVDTYAEVWFYSEQSFLNDVIAPYYEKLGLGSKPATLDTFANNSLPPLTGKLPGAAMPQAMYEHLERYHKNIGKYRHLFRSVSPLKISKEQIREYVAQDTPNGERVYFNYMAVREVKIICNFPNEDVGQIALVDMPGLGDTGVGDDVRLVKTLGEDVDIVLFIRMPKTTGDYWADVDVQLYDLVNNALDDLPTSLWSFLVLNRTNADSKNGDNWDNCQDLKNTLDEKHITVAYQMIANCADSAEAGQVLDAILSYMTDNITRLDKQYATSLQKRLERLQGEIANELEKARAALNHVVLDNSEFRLFENLFDQFWGELTNGLENLLKELREQRDFPDIDFQEQIDVTLKTCKQDTGIPSIQQIENRRNRVGGYPNAYYEYLNEIRAYLSGHFLSIDEALKKGLLRVKSNVTDVLVEAGLGNLANVRGVDFLQILAQNIPKELIEGIPSQLKQGFEILASFELSYRGLIQHRIRLHLDLLTPDGTNLQLTSSPTASEVRDCLTTLQEEAIYQCETALDDLVAEPNQAAFAIVEEFVDRVLRAEGVKKEWRFFLQEVRSEVWTNQFSQLGERTKTRREWLTLVEQANDANNPDLMHFID